MAAAAAGSDDAKIIHALNVMCRMPPARVEADSEKLAALLGEDAGEDLLEKVDRPLKVATCASTKKAYLQCDYNRDGDSYRSPWSNVYEPPLEPDEDGETGYTPPAPVRAMEQTANELLAIYAAQYYGHGTATSAYLWDQEGSGVAGCFLVRKEIEGSKEVSKAVWNTINVVEAVPAADGAFQYRLTTSLVLDVAMRGEAVGDVSLAGTLNRKASKVAKPPTQTATGAGASQPDHVAVWGEMVEAMESSLRDTVEGVYVIKTLSVMDATRKLGSGTGPAASANFVASLNAAVVAHGTKRSSLDG